MTKANHYYFGVVSTTALALMVALLFGLLIIIMATKPAHAATTFTVNSPGDAGDKTPGDGSCFTGLLIFNVGQECTLRAAIQEANATKGADTIAFGIPGNGPHTISPASALPTITKRVTIDGYTQPGASANTNTDLAQGTNAVLMIELDGTKAGVANGRQNGLQLNGPGASNSVIRGLVINNSASGISLLVGTGYKIEGNFIGTDPSGTAAKGNSIAVTIFANNSTLGGTTPDKRNLLSGNGSFGIEVASGRNRIQGNLIGTKANGTEALGNGGPSGGAGVEIDRSSSNTIGDSDPTDGATNAANTIAFNKGYGVLIVGSTTAIGNRILSNSIFSNEKLGINLEGGTQDAHRVTANDPDDPITSKPDPDKDTGTNNLQNYPDITSARIMEDPFSSDDPTTIVGELNSTPSTKKKKSTFTIQFFSSPAGETDPSGYGEGKTFLGEIQVTTDRQGDAPISFSTRAVSEGEFITATATNTKTGDTSEFSEVERVEPLVIGP